MTKAFLALVIFIFVIAQVSATTQISIYIDESGDAQFLGETNEQISLPAGIVIENGNIRGTTQELTSKQGEIWRFSYNLDNSEINVILPKGAEITSIDSGEISFYGPRFSIYTPGKIDVAYKINDLYSYSSYWEIVIFILLVAIVFFVWNRKKKLLINSKMDKTDAVFSILNDREKKIIEELRKTGKIKSSHLRRLCEIPKASFSRHVHELERKNLVKLSGEGKNKFIDLE